MPFRIRLEARTWFRDIRENGFAIDFDSYYFCFMAGITARRKSDSPTTSTAELVDYFPDRYKSRGKLLVALFLSRELQQLGVNVNDKVAVNSVISRLISPESPNYLSDEGVREFNKYAHAGFDVLLSWFDDRPRDLGTFLRMFKIQLDSVLQVP